MHEGFIIHVNQADLELAVNKLIPSSDVKDVLTLLYEGAILIYNFLSYGN